MRNKKAIFAGALMVPALALTGGIAYATTTGSPATQARPAATATVQPSSHHPAGQNGYRCNGRYGDHRCDWRGHRHPTQITPRRATQHHAYRHRNQHSYRGNWGYQRRNGYNHQGGWGYRGNWGYQGSGHYGTGSQWGNGSGCCGHGW